MDAQCGVLLIDSTLTDTFVGQSSLSGLLERIVQLFSSIVGANRVHAHWRFIVTCNGVS